MNPLRVFDPFGERPKVAILDPCIEALFVTEEPPGIVTLRTDRDILDFIGKLNAARMEAERTARTERMKREALMERACRMVWNLARSCGLKITEAENLADQLHETVAKVEKEQKGAKEWA